MVSDRSGEPDLKAPTEAAPVDSPGGLPPTESSSSPSQAVINEVLADLRRIPEVKGVCIVRQDGRLLGHKLASGADAPRVGRLVAAVLATSEMVAAELDEGGFYQTIVDCVNGRILGYRAAGDLLVVVLLEPGANLGLNMLSVRRAASRLQKERSGASHAVS